MPCVQSYDGDEAYTGSYGRARIGIDLLNRESKAAQCGGFKGADECNAWSGCVWVDTVAPRPDTSGAVVAPAAPHGTGSASRRPTESSGASWVWIVLAVIVVVVLLALLWMRGASLEHAIEHDDGWASHDEPHAE